jgi:hypothetical protein
MQGTGIPEQALAGRELMAKASSGKKGTTKASIKYEGHRREESSSVKGTAMYSEQQSGGNS